MLAGVRLKKNSWPQSKDCMIKIKGSSEFSDDNLRKLEKKEKSPNQKRESCAQRDRKIGLGRGGLVRGNREKKRR